MPWNNKEIYIVNESRCKSEFVAFETGIKR